VPAPAALLGAAVFGLHPVQTEAVAYVSGRTDLLMTTGALLSCAALLCAGPALARGGAAAAAGALAMLSKESGYALVLLWPWLVWHRARARERLSLLAPGALVALLLLALRPAPLPELSVACSGARLAAIGQAMLAYAAVLAWPVGLQVDRLTPLPAGAQQGIAGLLALVVALALVGWGLSRRAPTGDWTAWTATWYLPVANVLAIYPAIADRALFTPEHNLYAPLGGLGVLAGLGALRVGARLRAPLRRAGLAAVVGLLTAWSALTAARCIDWHDEERLFGAAVAAGSASPRVWYDYGNALLQRGAAGAAADAYEGAAQRGPNDAAIWSNLGVARQRQGSHDAAERAYRRAAELAPHDAQIFENLGTLYLARGDLDAARAAFTTALRLDPQRTTAQRAQATIGRR
jgi:tetratricopeptide (TPR) repeat protein